MEKWDVEKWLDEVLPKHHRLTGSVVTVIENLLRTHQVDYLTVAGRTKRKDSALEKIKRKGYKDATSQLTDLSGVRVVVYLESDVEKVSAMINEGFCVDSENSLNKDELFQRDQIGYRAVHFVCDLGPTRSSLPEFRGLSNLKFELQVRTVLQHAWAELAHDRNYKFSGKLPKSIERTLFLYAGMLEIADKGFDELSKQIDSYIERLPDETTDPDWQVEVNGITLKEFVLRWCSEQEVTIDASRNEDSGLPVLISELSQYGINKISELRKIIPYNYHTKFRQEGKTTNIFGLVRDWMLINDWRGLLERVDFNWVLEAEDVRFYAHFLDSSEIDAMFRELPVEPEN